MTKGALELSLIHICTVAYPGVYHCWFLVLNKCLRFFLMLIICLKISGVIET